jgi:hypothetical protein
MALASEARSTLKTREIVTPKAYQRPWEHRGAMRLQMLSTAFWSQSFPLANWRRYHRSHHARADPLDDVEQGNRHDASISCANALLVKLDIVPSHRSFALVRGAGCHQHGPSPDREIAIGFGGREPSTRRGTPFEPGRKPQSFCRRRWVRVQTRFRACQPRPIPAPAHGSRPYPDRAGRG